MLFTDRNFDVGETLREVASEIGRPTGQVALAWASGRSGVCSLLIGASRVEQLHENMAALDITFSPDQQARLNAAGALPTLSPYFIFDLPRSTVFGGREVHPWPHR